GDVAPVQQFTTSYGSAYSAFSNMQTSNIFYKDASYIRLKNLALSWELPQSWKTKIHLKNCRVYIQGQNLWTFTNFKGLDPENASVIISNLPPLRIVTTGVQVKL